MVVNPKKKSGKKHGRKSSRHRNPGSFRKSHKSGHRRSARRNPLDRIAGVPVMNVLIGAAAGLATVIGVNALAQRVQALQNPVAKAITKAVAVAAGGLFLPKVMGAAAAVPVVTGAGVVVAADAFREFVAPKFPGLSDLSDSPYAELSDFVNTGGVADFVRTGGSLNDNGAFAWQ